MHTLPGQCLQLAQSEQAASLHGSGGQGSAVERWHWALVSPNPPALRNRCDGAMLFLIPAEGLALFGPARNWNAPAVVVSVGQPHGGCFLSSPSSHFSPVVPDLVYQATSKPTKNVCSVACRDLTGPKAELRQMESYLLQGQTTWFPLCKKESWSVGLAFETRHLLC